MTEERIITLLEAAIQLVKDCRGELTEGFVLLPDLIMQYIEEKEAN